MQARKTIPNIFTFALWYIFKSPQRKFGWHTLWKDILGIIWYLMYYLWPSKKLENISICVGIKNRTELFSDALLNALQFCENKECIELSIYDCDSDDVNELKERIQKHWKGQLVFNSEKKTFSRSFAFNQAIKQSANELIFICDADISIPNDIVRKVNHFTRFHFIWYPIVFYIYKHKPPIYHPNNGEWMQWGGKGILACHKSDFNEVGAWNEKFVVWGQEDDELWERFLERKYKIIRNRDRKLIHYWHPSFNPKYQKLETWADAKFNSSKFQ